MKRFIILASLVAISGSLSAQNYDGRTDRYGRNEYGQANKAVSAVIVGINGVQVGRQGSAGMVVGAVVGGVAGNQGFRNRGSNSRAIGTVGGVILGGLIGRAVEHRAYPKSQSVEVLIQIADGSVYSVVQVDSGLRVGQAVWVIRAGETYRLIAR